MHGRCYKCLIFGPKMFQFFAAIQYQHHFLMKEAGLCQDIPFDDLKKIALESGTRYHENLSLKMLRK